MFLRIRQIRTRKTVQCSVSESGVLALVLVLLLLFSFTFSVLVFDLDLVNENIHFQFYQTSRPEAECPSRGQTSD